MITKKLSKKQIIIPIRANNAKTIIKNANKHIFNINTSLKGAKSDTITDFIQADNKNIVITTNKATSASNLIIIERYFKNDNNIDSENMASPYLPQSKSYLRILDISQFINNSNFPIFLNIIEEVIKNSHVFNNITLALHPYLIKAFPKSDIVVVWIDIQDSQSKTKVKSIINQYFNISHHIAIVCGINMKPSVLQCKNYQKWGYTTSTC